jgi:bifunctional non-homologous end joining protein LigD
MGLSEYNRKRNFAVTAEPPGEDGHPRPSGARGFVIQKHAATRLHYDFRLELDGVLLSWSVPKGPSLDPKVKRLAMQTEDHPIAYADFEGIIPKGQYGGGTVLLWDRGTWEPLEDPHKGYAKGNLKFLLKGAKLHGGFALVKIRGRAGGERDAERAWLLVKERDATATDGPAAEITAARPESVSTGRTIEEIAAVPTKARIWHSKPAHVDPTALPGAKAAPLPATLHPPKAAKRTAPPDGDDWLHEPEVEGTRLIAVVDNSRVRLLDASGARLTPAAAKRQEAMAEAVRLLPASNLIVDGVVAPSPTPGGAPTYLLFDLPYIDGHDLRATPLARRKALLEELVRRAPAGNPIRFGEHIAGNGPGFQREAARLGMTGMISRRADSVYGARAGWVRVGLTKGPSSRPSPRSRGEKVTR